MEPDQDDKRASSLSVLEADSLEVALAFETATALVRRNFSIPHLKAAEHFYEELRRHEEQHAEAGWGPHFDFCSWNGSAAIILSFCAIEAGVDEAEDDLGLPTELANALDRVPTLDHAQALLAHRGIATFDRAVEPFQSAHLLRALRNGLVHPKAEWDNAKDQNEKLSRKILGAQLKLSPFQPDPALAFPHGCMSAAVARWSALSARLFIRELRSRLGLRPTA
jgi:hypothetical protein